MIAYTLQRPLPYLPSAYSMVYPSDFVIIIPDKTTTNVISWHQMDTHVVLDTWLVLEVLRYYYLRLLYRVCNFARPDRHPPHGRPWRLQFTVGRYLIVHRRCMFTLKLRFHCARRRAQ